MPTTISGLIRLIVAAFFIAGTIIASGALYLALRNEALATATTRSQLLISAVGAVRDYTDQEVFPAVGGEGNGVFHKESVPFFAAKSVFSRVAALFPAYWYRQTALNPTNTDDRPGPFEVDLIDRFKVNVGLDELSGFAPSATRPCFTSRGRSGSRTRAAWPVTAVPTRHLRGWSPNMVPATALAGRSMMWSVCSCLPYR